MLLVIIIDHSLTTIGLDGKGEGGGLRNCHKKQVFMKEQIHVSCWHDRDLINKKLTCGENKGYIWYKMSKAIKKAF